MGLQDTMKALSDPTRREILRLLKEGRRSAGEICGHFSISNASISRHLAVLRQAGLVREEIRFLRRHLAGWMRPRRVPSPWPCSRGRA